jgi:large subunit ribosomal protein L31e
MAKKKTKDRKLDDLEEELTKEDESSAHQEEEKIEEIDEFSLDEITEEEAVSDVFKEELEEVEEVEEEVKEEIIDERIYIIPLSKARRGPRTKWAKKSIRYLKDFMERHFKPESLVISQEVNEAIWARGIQKPPRKLKVRATKNIDGLVVVYLGR